VASVKNAPHRMMGRMFRSFGRDERYVLVFSLSGFILVAIACQEVRQGLDVPGIASIRGVTVEVHQAQRLSSSRPCSTSISRTLLSESLIRLNGMSRVRENSIIGATAGVFLRAALAMVLTPRRTP
jgi:hypothetical protein